MNTMSKREFKEEDFVRLFFYSMHQSGNSVIFQNEITKKLYAYKRDEKYRKLFKDIVSWTYGYGVNIFNGLNNVKYSGCVSWMSDDCNKLFVNDVIAEYKPYIEQTYGEEVIKLMQQLVDEYNLRVGIERELLKRGLKVNILAINPNKEYHLASGISKHRNELVTWQLITDGILTENRLSEAKDIPTSDPTEKFDGILIGEGTRRLVGIGNASFVIEQGISEFNRPVANLYTKELDKSTLEQLADKSISYYNSETSETLTSEKPYVFSLRRR